MTMAPQGRRSARQKAVNGGATIAETNISKRTLRHRKSIGDNDTTPAKKNKTQKPSQTSSISKENIKPTAEEVKPMLTNRRPELVCPGVNPVGLHSNNLLYRLKHSSLGISHGRSLREAVVQSYGEQLPYYQVLTTASPFDRRVTAMQWHPTHPTTLAVGSKGGDLILWDYSKTEGGITFVQGIGKGGSITNLHIDETDPSYLYTSSIDGMVSRQDFNGNNRTTFLNTNDWSFWYCSLDVNYKSNVLVAGDSRGNTVMMTRQGEKAWSHRLHKQKVTHCEFNKQCEWLLVTASTDKIVKLWDIRMVSGRNSALYQLPHERPINSAYFSPNSTRLLTTDQNLEIRVYNGPLWDRMERSIAHPHRFFQHITPIKASWHPIHDLIVIGRYPDPHFPGFCAGERTIDVFDANTGEAVCQMMDGSAPGIKSLCQFNRDGDYLAAGMGQNILIWADVAKLTGQQDTRRSSLTFKPNKGTNASQRRRNRKGKNVDDDDDNDDIDQTKKKLKLKVKMKTQTKTTKSSKR